MLLTASFSVVVESFDFVVVSLVLVMYSGFEQLAVVTIVAGSVILEQKLRVVPDPLAAAAALVVVVAAAVLVVLASAGLVLPVLPELLVAVAVVELASPAVLAYSAAAAVAVG